MFEKTREWALAPSRKKTVRRIIIVLIITILLVGLWLINIDEQRIQQMDEQSSGQTKNGPRP